jgi:hypothetical protein
MRDLSFFLVWFMVFGVSLLSSAYPLVGHFLVQFAFARIALVIAAVLSGVALLIGVASPRGVAPLHQLLLLR